MHASHTITITAGIGYAANGEALKPEAQAIALATIRATLATMYGGYTETDSTGGWVDPSGRLITEPGKVWTVATWDRGDEMICKAKRAAESVRHLLDQTAVVLSIAESSAAFIEAAPVTA